MNLTEIWNVTLEAAANATGNDFWLVFFGAFSGALLAFILSSIGAWQKNFTLNFRAGLKAQATLLVQMQELDNIDSKLIADYRGKEEAYRTIPHSLVMYTPIASAIDVNSLIFILETPKIQVCKIFNDCIFAQNDFDDLVKIINKRNRLIEEKKDELGSEEFTKDMKNIEENLYIAYDSSRVSNEKAFRDLRDFLKEYIRLWKRLGRLRRKQPIDQTKIDVDKG